MAHETFLTIKYHEDTKSSTYYYCFHIISSISLLNSPLLHLPITNINNPYSIYHYYYQTTTKNSSNNTSNNKDQI